MRAFLFLNLEVSEHPVSYAQPEVQLVKKHFRDVAILDMDAASDEMLLHYARRMLQEADQSVVCVKANDPASFRSMISILEETPQAKGSLLFLLIGENQRLQRIMAARPTLKFEEVKSDVDLLQKLSAFYS